MIDDIIRFIMEMLLYMISIAVYVFIVGSILPSRLLCLEYKEGKTNDRGIKKYSFPDGRSIVYEPHPSIRRYVKSYMLFEKDGTKYIRCTIPPEVKSIDYGAVIFDNNNKVVDVVRVSEDVCALEMSGSVKLPTETSYISFLLYEVNGKRIMKERQFDFDAKQKKIFVGITVLLTVIEAFALRFMAISVMDFLKLGDFWFGSSVNALVTLIAAIIIGLVGALLSLKSNSKRGRVNK